MARALDTSGHWPSKFGRVKIESKADLDELLLLLEGQVEVVNWDRSCTQANMLEQVLQLFHKSRLPTPLHSLHANHQRLLVAGLFMSLYFLPTPEKDWQVVLVHSLPAVNARWCSIIINKQIQKWQPNRLKIKNLPSHHRPTLLWYWLQNIGTKQLLSAKFWCQILNKR